jgi:hypothetical protein
MALYFPPLPQVVSSSPWAVDHHRVAERSPTSQATKPSGQCAEGVHRVETMCEGQPQDYARRSANT